MEFEYSMSASRIALAIWSVLHSVIVSMDYNAAQCLFKCVTLRGRDFSVFVVWSAAIFNSDIFSCVCVCVCDIVLVGLLSLLLRSVGDADHILHLSHACQRTFVSRFTFDLSAEPPPLIGRMHSIRQHKTKQDKWRGINKDLARWRLLTCACVVVCTGAPVVVAMASIARTAILSTFFRSIIFDLCVPEITRTIEQKLSSKEKPRKRGEYFWLFDSSEKWKKCHLIGLEQSEMSTEPRMRH